MAGSGSNGFNESTDDMFAQPLGLAKLARFIVEMHKQNGKWAGFKGQAGAGGVDGGGPMPSSSKRGERKGKPLVLLAERAHTFLVLGVECKDNDEPTGSFLAKNFAIAMRHARLHDGGGGGSLGPASVRTTFDNATIEVRREDAHKFLESLHLTMHEASRAAARMKETRASDNAAYLESLGAEGEAVGADGGVTVDQEIAAEAQAPEEEEPSFVGNHRRKRRRRTKLAS